MLILYSKQGCTQCNAIKRWLSDPKRGVTEGIDYVVKDVSWDLEAYQEIVALDYGAVPVVRLPNGEHFYGFQPQKLDEWLDSLHA